MIPWRLGGKQLSKVDRALYTKTPYPKALTSIKVYFGVTNLTVNSCKLIYSTKEDFSESKEITVDFVASNEKGEEVVADFPANAYYKIVFNVTTSGTRNQYVELSKIEFLGIE